MKNYLRSAYQRVSRRADKSPNPLAQGEHTVALAGLNFHYTVVGKGPVAIIPTPGHGISCDHFCPELVEKLKKHFTLVLFDTRGTSKSERPNKSQSIVKNDPYHFNNLIFDLEFLRKHLGQEKITLIGGSLGSVQAAVYAAMFSAKTRSLLLISTTPLIHDRAYIEALEKATERVKNEPWFQQAQKASYAAPLSKTDEESKKVFCEAIPFYFYDNSDIEKNTGPFRKETYNAEAIRTLYTAPSLTPELLANVKAPTLIINGCQDMVTLPLDAERVHKGIAGSKLVMIEKSGHFPFLENPAAFFSAVKKEIPFLLPEQKNGKRKLSLPFRK